MGYGMGAFGDIRMVSSVYYAVDFKKIGFGFGFRRLSIASKLRLFSNGDCGIRP